MKDSQNRLPRYSIDADDAVKREAGYDKLVIGVHTLTEFEFCSRAGLVAHESNAPDMGDEWEGTALDYSPQYDYRAICRQLNRLMDRLLPWLLVAIGIFIATVVCMLLISRVFVFSGLIAMVIVAIPPSRLLLLAIPLADRKRAADRAKSRKPDENSPLNEQVNWWEIRKAGFDASSFRDRLVDSQTGLRGQPRMVLRSGEMVIPVFFYNGGEIKRQHYVRIAAYCQLVEHAELAKSPYGLVVERGTYEAHVLKNTKQSQKTLEEELQAARRVIGEEVASGEVPLPPKSPSKCKNCPIGRPRRYQPGTTELVCKDVTLPVRPLRATARGPIYHSQCGDRFRWTPPHELLAVRGLKETG